MSDETTQAPAAPAGDDSAPAAPPTQAQRLDAVRARIAARAQAGGEARGGGRGDSSPAAPPAETPVSTLASALAAPEEPDLAARIEALGRAEEERWRQAAAIKAREGKLAEREAKAAEAEAAKAHWDDPRALMRRVGELARAQGLDAEKLAALWVEADDPRVVAQSAAAAAQEAALKRIAELEARIEARDREAAQARAEEQARAEMVAMTRQLAARAPLSARCLDEQPQVFWDFAVAQAAQYPQLSGGQLYGRLLQDLEGALGRTRLFAPAPETRGTTPSPQQSPPSPSARQPSGTTLTNQVSAEAHSLDERALPQRERIKRMKAREAAKRGG